VGLRRKLGLFVEDEWDGDRGVHFHWFAIEQRRLVGPLTGCDQRCLDQERVAGEDEELADCAVAANDGVEHYGPLDVGLAGNWRICGRYVVNDHRGLHALTDLDARPPG
jgi:hypothetical protein